MSTTSRPPPPPRFVVVAGVDGSPLTERVVRAAANHASMVEGGELHLVYVEGNLPAADPLVPVSKAMQVTRERLERGSALVAAHVEQIAASGFKRVSGHVFGGDAWRGILQASAHVSADLIVVGTHGRTGLDRLVLGSVAETVVRKAPCPVLVVRPKEWNAREFPEIEPPCPDCQATQEETSGKKLWCQRHAERHPHGHLHYELPAGYGGGSMLIG